MSHERPRYKWELVLLFWFAYFLNQGDRQIFNSVLPLIKTDLHTDDVHLGMVATAFTFVYGVLVPFAGCLGDFVSRKWIVCLSLLTFSAGTLLTGLSGGLLALVIFRSIATGAGEAFYYPAATSLLSQYHRETRAQAMAIHQTSLYVGIVTSSWLAAFIGERYGWRSSFYTFGSFGLALAVIMTLRMKNDRREPVSPEAAALAAAKKSADAPKLSEVLRVILRKPTLYFLSLAFGGMVFVNVGFMTWMPTFLYEKFHLSLQAAGFHSMIYHYLFAFFGVMLGGRISDRLASRRPKVRMEIEFWGLFLGAPCIALIGLFSNLTLVYVALAAFGLFRGFYDSNLFAALFDVIPPRYRSSATGLMLSCAFTVGATSPVLLGYLKQHIDLGLGLSALGLVYLFGAALIFIAMKRFFAQDYHNETSAP